MSTGVNVERMCHAYAHLSMVFLCAYIHTYVAFYAIARSVRF